MPLESLPKMVMKAVHEADNDPDAQAAIVEVQARMLGMSIALMTNGDARAANELLEGASQYAIEQAASTQQIDRMLNIALKKIGH